MSDGTSLPLALERYLGVADETDRSLLQDIRGPVLDVGCGPGRHLHILARQGVFALGVDLSPVAVELARGRGARAIVASVFDELPGPHWWRTALLLDGNVGIGGSPGRLLARIARLLAPGGEVIVELGGSEAPSGPVEARLESSSGTSAWFPWAMVGYDEIDAVAGSAGYRVSRRWSGDGRWFARLSRPDI
jgi:SAM-dependent methyltransferase